MKLLFIIPSSKSPFDGIIPNPAIATLVEVYSKYFAIEVLDMNIILKLSSLEQKIKKIKPDVVGLTTTIDNYNEASKIAIFIKKKFSEIKTLLGGPHISLLGRTGFLFPKEFDIIVQGEGESHLKNIQTLVHSKLNEQHLLPYLRYSKFECQSDINWKSVYDPNHHAPFFNIETSRGCAFSCPFCAHPILAGNVIRKKNRETLIAQFEYLKYKQQINHIRFTDSTFTTSQSNFYFICDYFQKANLNFEWSCFARIRDLNERLLNEAANANCKAMFVGIESAEHKRLKELKKDFSFNKIKKILRLAEERDILIFCNFIHGLPGDDNSSAMEIIKFVSEFELNYVNVNQFHLIPDSPYVKNNTDWGITIKPSWLSSLHNQFSSPNDASYFQTRELTQEQMKINIQLIKERLNELYVFWDLRDYKLIFWNSIGGDRKSLEKAWNNPQKFLSGFTLRCFNEFKTRKEKQFTNKERMNFLPTLQEAVSILNMSH